MRLNLFFASSVKVVYNGLDLHSNYWGGVFYGQCLVCSSSVYIIFSFQ